MSATRKTASASTRKRAAAVKRTPALKPKPHPTPAERPEKGRTARATVPLTAHEQFSVSTDREDPVAILERRAQSRVPEGQPSANREPPSACSHAAGGVTQPSPWPSNA